MMIKARKSPERKAKKLKVFDGSTVALVHILIKRKDMYIDFVQEVAIALDCQNLYYLEEDDIEHLQNTSAHPEVLEVYKLMYDALNPNNNYKVMLALTTPDRYYYGILVEGKLYLFFCYDNYDLDATTKKLALHKVNTYHPDYIMEHTKSQILALDKFGLVGKELKNKLDFSNSLREIRKRIAGVYSFKKRLFQGKVQL